MTWLVHPLPIRFAALALLAFVLVTPGLATEGVVVDVEGQAIAGARVCYLVEKVELLCAGTDAEGRFVLPTSALDTMRAVAEGYNPKTFAPATLDGPITLERAPELLVRLTDRASGERIEKGDLIVVYPNGKAKGPFPTNAAGVRIRRGLPPGEVRLIGRAEGYLDSPQRAATLKPGEKLEIVLELELDAAPEDDGAD